MRSLKRLRLELCNTAARSSRGADVSRGDRLSGLASRRRAHTHTQQQASVRNADGVLAVAQPLLDALRIPEKGTGT